ncbi:MAG: glycosyl hydrolase family 2 [Muribaculaceae bacterium]|nr:glycosyl hydrolase family 2 [Muribaculaceae bacterium]
MPDFEDYGTGCFLLGATEYYKLLKKEKATSLAWPSVNTEAGPGTRWWWPGSAVNRQGIEFNLNNLADIGIKTVEITPIYGVQGNETADIDYLSPRWMDAYKDVVEVASSRGMEVDMNNGTGWPFGGPTIDIARAACKAVFVDTIVNGKPEDLQAFVPQVTGKDREHARLQTVQFYPTSSPDSTLVIALYIAPTMQKVKRAAPGGEGLVVDHFDREAVRHYLERFDSAFAASGAPFPATFFNDSYEVYKANWTPRLLDEFAKRRGYRLEEHFPQLLGMVDDGNKVLADYRETLSDLLYENFTCQWTDWAHSHGAKVRNQAHGSPANLLDLYAEVDIPEIEGFGLTDFGIKGLRTDPEHVRPNFSDVSMLKYASSAAHVAGKPLVSSETFTWLTEHFRTSLSQMKPDLDQMFTCGVNHVFFHGTCYSPVEAAWPGWRFYASIDMSPANSIWRDAPALNEYITRCQSFLQAGEPDNDFLVYLPIHDLWRQRNTPGVGGLLLSFDIHSMERKAPEFIKSILKIDSIGFDCDYISDRQLALSKLRPDGQIETAGGARYKGIVIPSGTTLSPELKELLAPFEGRVIYGEDEEAMRRFATPEAIKATPGLRAVRRKNLLGNHYFIANLSPNDVDTVFPLAVEFTDAAIFNPMTGEISGAEADGKNVRLNLASGESTILLTSHSALGLEPKPVHEKPAKVIDLTPGRWELKFVEEAPAVNRTFKLNGLSPWQILSPEAAVTMGTGVYTTKVKIDKKDADMSWVLDLGDVRESARVFVNGEYIGTAWAVPYRLDIGHALKKGNNEITIEVTNLPANRIADLDRRGIDWRIMKEINVVGLDYKPANYADWTPVPSGLNSTVKLLGYPQ